MVRHPRLLIGAAASLLAVAAGAWALSTRPAPPAPSTAEAAAVLARIEPGVPAATSGPTPGPASSPDGGATATIAPAPFAGSWTLLAGTPSALGYRVEQILAGQGVSTVVGKTTAATATFTVEGGTLTAAHVTADLTQLSSDQVLRDRKLRDSGLQTGAFPTARFTLSRPVDVSALTDDGAVLRVVAEGELELHGVRRPVSVPLDVQARNGAVAVTGAFMVALADFGIEQPHVATVLSIAETGVIELQLFLSRS